MDLITLATKCVDCTMRTPIDCYNVTKRHQYVLNDKLSPFLYNAFNNTDCDRTDGDKSHIAVVLFLCAEKSGKR